MRHSAQGATIVSKADVVPDYAPWRSRTCEESKLVWGQLDRLGQRCWLWDRAGLSCLKRRSHLSSAEPLGLEVTRERYSKRRTPNLSCIRCLATGALFFPLPLPHALRGKRTFPAPWPDPRLEAGRLAQSSLTPWHKIQ